MKILSKKSIKKTPQNYLKNIFNKKLILFVIGTIIVTIITSNEAWGRRCKQNIAVCAMQGVDRLIVWLFRRQPCKLE